MSLSVYFFFLSWFPLFCSIHMHSFCSCYILYYILLYCFYHSLEACMFPNETERGLDPDGRKETRKRVYYVSKGSFYLKE